VAHRRTQRVDDWRHSRLREKQCVGHAMQHGDRGEVLGMDTIRIVPGPSVRRTTAFKTSLPHCHQAVLA
jgi:hypothetical protein